MNRDQKIDPTSTYVLDETAITKTKSIDELAAMAMREGVDDEADDDLGLDFDIALKR